MATETTIEKTGFIAARRVCGLVPTIAENPAMSIGIEEIQGTADL